MRADRRRETGDALSIMRGIVTSTHERFRTMTLSRTASRCLLATAIVIGSATHCGFAAATADPADAVAHAGGGNSGDAAVDVDAQVLRQARAWLDDYARRHDLRHAEIGVALLPSRHAAPACDRPYEIAAADASRPDRLRVAVRCPGQTRATVYPVRATLRADVLVTLAAVPAGTALAATDVTLASRDVAGTPDAMTDPAAITGRVSRRALKAGQIVQARVLTSVDAVRRGQAVRIVSRAAGVEVTTTGVALQNGARNDAIRVRNARTGKVIAARVVAPDVVEPIR
ncbi:MAG: flagellar basal body P-ring formation chaperone FlgA [Burkholderia sp.]